MNFQLFSEGWQQWAGMPARNQSQEVSEAVHTGVCGATSLPAPEVNYDIYFHTGTFVSPSDEVVFRVLIS